MVKPLLAEFGQQMVVQCVLCGPQHNSTRLLIPPFCNFCNVLPYHHHIVGAMASHCDRHYGQFSIAFRLPILLTILLQYLAYTPHIIDSKFLSILLSVRSKTLTWTICCRRWEEECDLTSLTTVAK
ncbi:hypothetical protein TNIN_10411 [Trichonephila inaurata madagascariensis]|uniref:Uncharacterized protein n=1 Tax=Trichonephila inaurata madagascariensis TaxID=2747483 RepID=A0A8X7BSE0_9ARAC|nr:hypothetical protein TNIN_10411 [Trichonephila inaurata madagascariensis]